MEKNKLMCYQAVYDKQRFPNYNMTENGVAFYTQSNKCKITFAGDPESNGGEFSNAYLSGATIVHVLKRRPGDHMIWDWFVNFCMQKCNFLDRSVSDHGQVFKNVYYIFKLFKYNLWLFYDLLCLTLPMNGGPVGRCPLVPEGRWYKESAKHG